MAVSVILKALNEEARIGPALESVLAALEGIGGEAIVADGGSRDQTLAIAAKYPVRIVQLEPAIAPSCGIGPQLGFQYSREPFICLMDGDMLLDPGFLPDALAWLANNPGAAGVTGHVVEMNDTSLEYVRRGRRVSPENRIGEIDRMNGGGLYRRAAIEQVGYLSDRNLHGYEEFDLGVRLRARGWTLHRLDRSFVRHFGHAVNAYALLVRRWKSGYLRGIGELLRAAFGKPQWKQLVQELPELKLWGAVYLWLAAMVVLPFLTSPPGLGLAIDAAMIAGVIGLMSVRQRSLTLGLYAVVAWLFHAAALPLGFFHSRQAPAAWIDSRVVRDNP
ncbi:MULTISPECIES: glycosyltransferase family 2 protein [Bradyrhizobium]|jgi:glycosyltransferase involved in cell wall biosynthesis|uniref:glycosyltransferase family 2 protein n=2 Tax=Pseudomonadota TaxID=1224 RepID=UPI000464B89A|nr:MULTISPECIES: glycosyltransferase family 2 protein [Bradyrhizobium]AUC94464.1 glycosyl transferase [Bradyrhizobium sp. SK17]KIU48678.1 glycosyl transferase [Bradyrhizobium elkanii]OCX29321.1 glycosyl transferase [Bradyrhizobium sp. UASWS1016]